MCSGTPLVGAVDMYPVQPTFRARDYTDIVNISPAPRRWTVMHVLNGDNNLREAATLQMARLHQEGSSDEVQVVASLFRGESEWNWRNLGVKLDELVNPTPRLLASASDWRGQKTFEVRHQDQPGSSPQLAESQSKPSDWRGLRDFLIDSMRRYPAEHYALFCTTHGAGEQGLLTDARGQRMSLADFQRAVHEAEQATQADISLLGLEACSMGQPSVMNRLLEQFDYIVASPKKIQSNATPADQLLRQLKARPDWSPGELAEETRRWFSTGNPSMQLFS